jgi:methyltransferase (TIGR00027 family)
MTDAPNAAPDNTAVRVALWRALHVQVDAPPHVLADEIGLRLVAPDARWRERPDMHPARTSRSRASIVARARFIEDLVEERATHGTLQYVLLGAGLDTFAQRRIELASRLSVFEVEQPGTQSWKRSRLTELGFTIPECLHLVPVDFEAHESWLSQLVRAGFEPQKPAVIASLGVAMYLTKEAIAATLRQAAKFLRATGNSRASSGGRLPRREARLFCESHGALLRGQSRRSSAVERRGIAAGDDVVAKAASSFCDGLAPLAQVLAPIALADSRCRRAFGLSTGGAWPHAA